MESEQWFNAVPGWEARKMQIHELHILVSKAATELEMKLDNSRRGRRNFVFECMKHKFIECDKEILLDSYKLILNMLKDV